MVIAWVSFLFTGIAATAPSENIYINYSRLLLPHFLVICLKIQFLVIFYHFLPFEPAHDQPLDPTSTFIDITIITGCCCKDIYGERATPDYYHSIPPSEA